jgi:hypothetical protein
MSSRLYRVTVQGELSARMTGAFEGMTLTTDAGNTILVGAIADQAQLQGLLSRISDLGLTLLDVGTLGEVVACGPSQRSVSPG